MLESKVGLVGYANDTSFIDFFKKALKEKKLEYKVSIVVCHYNQFDNLDVCLSHLQNQTYPLDLMEVVIADDGSTGSFDTLYSKYESVFGCFKVVSQEDVGFRLSAVRNLGISHTQHEYLVLLDCDMIPHVDFIMEHMRVVSISKNTISIGFRKDGASIEDVKTGVLLESELDWRVEKLKREAPDFFKMTNQPYCFCSGGNLAFHKSAFEKHEFDEEFDSWGGEDNEWAYRLTKEGYYFYPNLEAKCWHLSDPSYKNNKTASRERYLQKCAGVSYENAQRKDLTTPYISFWITSFNKSKYLREAIMSVVNFPLACEVVVVDNNSTDGSIKIIEELCSEFSNVKLFKESTQGPYYAFERALSECKGELLVQLDADDTVVPESIIQIVIETFYESYGLMFGLTQVCDLELKPCENGVWIPPENDIRAYNLLTGMSLRSPRILQRRDLSRSPQRTAYNAAVDYELYTKVLMVSKPFRKDIVMYNYRTFTENSITRTCLSDQKANALKIAAKNKEILSEINCYVEHLHLNKDLISKDMVKSMVEACGYVS